MRECEIRQGTTASFIVSSGDPPSPKTKKPRSVDHYGVPSQANERIRTADLLITSELLYQLSYVGTRAQPWSVKTEIPTRAKGGSMPPPYLSTENLPPDPTRPYTTTSGISGPGRIPSAYGPSAPILTPSRTISSARLTSTLVARTTR